MREQEAYKKGFDEGYDAGYRVGLDVGSDEGYTRGYRDYGIDHKEIKFNGEYQFVVRFLDWLVKHDYFDSYRKKEVISAWGNGEIYREEG